MTVKLNINTIDNANIRNYGMPRRIFQQHA